MLKKLSWRPLDQRRIDTRLIMLYKITYDLVALTPNRRQSKFIHRWHTDKSALLPITASIAFFQELQYIGTLYPSVLSCSPPWHCSVMLFARWCMCLPNHQILFFFLFFFYLLRMFAANEKVFKLFFLPLFFDSKIQQKTFENKINIG